MLYSEIQTYASLGGYLFFWHLLYIWNQLFLHRRRSKSYTRWIFFRGSFNHEWLTSLPKIQQNFKCPTIGFTCKQRQLYSINGSLLFPVWQTVFSTPIETCVIFRVVAMNDNQLSHIKWAYCMKFGGASVIPFYKYDVSAYQYKIPAYQYVIVSY